MMFCTMIVWRRDTVHAQDTDPPVQRGQRLGTIQQTLPNKPRAGSLFSIGILPRYTPPMALGDGKDLVDAYCTTCHSTSYITMQPPFPGSVWRKEVEKMIVTYGASIPKATADKIVAYLTRHYSPTSIAQTYINLATAPKPVEKTRPAQKTTGVEPRWMKQAQSLYLQKCVACHQAHGGGLPGAVPPLVGHVQQFAQTPERRAYLVRALLYGLQGTIQVLGKTYAVMMPPLPPTTDEELALILNYVTRAWGNQARQKDPLPSFSVQDIKKQRGLSLSPVQVYDMRKTLGLSQ